jgi:hypothetical protein
MAEKLKALIRNYPDPVVGGEVKRGGVVFLKKHHPPPHLSRSMLGVWW